MSLPQSWNYPLGGVLELSDDLQPPRQRSSLLPWMPSRAVVFLVALVTSIVVLPVVCTAISANISGSQKASMKPGRPSWKKLPPADKEIVAEVAKQLRLIGDKYNMEQKIMNIVTKILRPGT